MILPLDGLPTQPDRELLITRHLRKPRAVVFRAWTQAEHLARWWGPRGFTITTHHIDVTPGGTWHFTMHGPDGTDHDNTIVYREVAPPERLRYVHLGDDGAPAFHTTVTFADRDGHTELTMRMVFPTAEALNQVRPHAEPGARSTLDRLAELLDYPHFRPSAEPRAPRPEDIL